MGWRVWLAFEARPGVMKRSERDLSRHWRALVAACRLPGGKLDAAEYERWLDLFIEYSHVWGEA